jgi:hypothetical protein
LKPSGDEVKPSADAVLARLREGQRGCVRFLPELEGA